jgi:hypothetical protein
MRAQQQRFSTGEAAIIFADDRGLPVKMDIQNAAEIWIFGFKTSGPFGMRVKVKRKERATSWRGCVRIS